MSHDSLLQSFVLCDSNPDDHLAWETFFRDLQRLGYNGPLTNFVKKHIDDHKWECTKRARRSIAAEAWAPLLSQGFVLFLRGLQWSCDSVFHIARLQLRPQQQWATGYYPEGWQYGDLHSLCYVNPGVVYPGGAWTQRKNPWNGNEHLPCKACLKRLHRLPWTDITPLTPEQVARIHMLRDRETMALEAEYLQDADSYESFV